MKVLVCNIFFCFLDFYLQPNSPKKVIPRLECSLSIYKTSENNLKFFQCQTSTAEKRWEKQLPSTGNFRTFLGLKYSNFNLQQCERP